MVEAVAHTGGVITSAGHRAGRGVRGARVLPLVTLGQLGLIVGVGVIVDTLVEVLAAKRGRRPNIVTAREGLF